MEREWRHHEMETLLADHLQLKESQDTKSLNRLIFFLIHIKSLGKPVNSYLPTWIQGFPMGLAGSEPDSDTSRLLNNLKIPPNKTPEDKWHLACIIYFTLGLGYLLPWNAFITAVDYFSYLYPEASVDQIFAVAYMLVGVVSLFIIILYSLRPHVYVRINVGLGLLTLALLIVPIIDALYIKGRVGLYDGFYVTVGAVALSGLGDALVQGGIVGSAGELPERYMQATIAGTAASGILSFSISSSAIYLPFLTRLQIPFRSSVAEWI